MNRRMLIVGGLVLSSSIFTGCNKSQNTEVLDLNNKIIEIEDKKIDFSKLEYKLAETESLEGLEILLKKYLNYNEDFGEIRYFYNYVDLKEGLEDIVFVYLIGDYVSGSGGGTGLLVDLEKLEIISEFSLVQNPIIISDNKTNGQKDIIMRVSGGGVESFYSVLQFDGKDYPENPSLEKKLDEGKVSGLAIISDNIDINSGIILK